MSTLEVGFSNLSFFKRANTGAIGLTAIVCSTEA